MQLAVVIRPSGDGGFWAEVPTLPGCVSQGASVEETVANVRGAVAGWVGYLRDKGLPVPDADATAVIIEIEG